MRHFDTDNGNTVNVAVCEIINVIQGIALTDLPLEFGAQISLHFSLRDDCNDSPIPVTVTGEIPPVEEPKEGLAQPDEIGATIFVSEDAGCPNHFRPNERKRDKNHAWIKEIRVNRQ